MTKKRQSSSVVNIMEDENLDILDIDADGADVDESAQDESYLNVEMSTDNIEDIVSAGKIDGKTNYDDVYMMDSQVEEKADDL